MVKITIKQVNTDDESESEGESEGTEDESEAENESNTEDESKDDDEENEKNCINRAGIIMECNDDFAFVIADASGFSGKIGVNTITVEFPDGEIVKPEVDHFHIKNGIIGIMCVVDVMRKFDTSLVKMINICDQPLEMSETVYVYEGFKMRLVPGRIMNFDGDQLSVSCWTTLLAEYGAPVVNQKGELIRMTFSLQHHLDVTIASAISDTVKSIKDCLYKSY